MYTPKNFKQSDRTDKPNYCANVTYNRPIRNNGGTFTVPSVSECTSANTNDIEYKDNTDTVYTDDSIYDTEEPEWVEVNSPYYNEQSTDEDILKVKPAHNYGGARGVDSGLLEGSFNESVSNAQVYSTNRGVSIGFKFDTNGNMDSIAALLPKKFRLRIYASKHIYGDVFGDLRTKGLRKFIISCYVLNIVVTLLLGLCGILLGNIIQGLMLITIFGIGLTIGVHGVLIPRFSSPFDEEKSFLVLSILSVFLIISAVICFMIRVSAGFCVLGVLLYMLYLIFGVYLYSTPLHNKKMELDRIAFETNLKAFLRHKN